MFGANVGRVRHHLAFASVNKKLILLDFGVQRRTSVMVMELRGLEYEERLERLRSRNDYKVW